MILKDYQKDTLATLSKFFELCRLFGPAEAYKQVVNEPEQKQRLGLYAQDYKPLEQENVPYVCLRLPTGGGKTILAARSIGIAKEKWVEKDFPTVLWLVPTNTIRQQTVEALKNPRHPYRKQMDEQFNGRVRVFDIGDFTNVRPQDVRDNLTVIVGTIQTLRVENTEGRKVYAHHEDMEPHFTKMPKNTEGLEKIEGSNKIKYSFVNLLHTLHPIMIVDEAHNAVTGLSREMQERVSPSCIIEFTATPRLNSNILHSATAQELKDEEMIKLPIVLAEHPSWQGAVDGAIQRRKELANIAEKDRDYIRPIVLFQAQKRNEEVTVDVLKDYLVDTCNIAEDKIAIATGDQRELDGINLFDEKCPIEYVITVEALKEGWDCSFAYIFCSVARIQSAGAVEQLLGRVLRMPFAKKREAAELNRSYAHVSEPTFSEAAKALRDKLVAMGFDEQEAALNIEQEIRNEDVLPLFGGGTAPRPKPTLSEDLEDELNVAELPEEDQAAIEVTQSSDGKTQVTVTGHVSEATLKAIKKAVPKAKQAGFEEKATEYRHKVETELSPAARKIPFRIPRLMAEIQGELEFAEAEVFDEYNDWSLLDYPTKLGESDFNVREDAEVWEIDLDGHRLTLSMASQDEQLSMDIAVEEWTENALTLSIDKLLRDEHRFSQGERVKWILNHVHHLVQDRGIPVSALWRAKFILGRKLKELIKGYKAEQAVKSRDLFLFAPEAKPTISFDETFEFKDGMYDGQKPYRGSYTFKNHYLDPVPEIDGKDDGEETKCALALDALPGLKFWLRNVSRHPASFYLPLAQGKTYPDFVAEMEDGRLLVVEYKGAHLLDGPETKEKRLIGELWEKAMKGKGLYIMAVEKDEQGRDVRAQLINKVS